MKFIEWYKLNRASLVSISNLFFVPGKWRKRLKALITFVDELVEEEVYVVQVRKIQDVA